MRTSTEAIRRGLSAVFAASAVGGAVMAALAVPPPPMTPSATAAPEPCAASEVAKTIGSVAASTGEYLEDHPQTNQALTTISQQQGGGPPASLPGGVPPAQTAGLPGAGTAAHSPAASSASQSSGPLPGSAIAGLP